MDILLEAFNKSKQAMVSDDIAETIEELQQSWDEFGLNHFDHVMDFTYYLSIYYEQLPRAKTSFIMLMITSCHISAADKYFPLDASLEKIDATYFGILSRHFSHLEMEYYRHLYKIWIATCHEEKNFKQCMPSIPNVRQFVWADWRVVNIGKAALLKMILMLNYPNEDLDIALVSSAIVYTAIQCALFNDVGSIVKDKDSTEVNYFIEVAPRKTQSLANIYEASNKHLATLDIPDTIKLVLKSAIDGSYLMYGISKRYFGKSEPNW
ncbi:hypothetical protein CPC16_003123 [Podila verticillata]|nr:hypothetical protein CPC16_003123 [Podila verticillata]